MRSDSRAAQARFQARVAELGGRIVEPVWLGIKRPHRVICADGHEVTPRPGDVNRGHGLCRVCSGKDQGTAWQLFLRLVEERGGEVLEPRPLGVNVPHRVRCSKGHETVATPSYVRVGGGSCNMCSATSSVRAEQQFRDLVAALDGSVVEPTWLGTKAAHRIICGQGHQTTRRPNDLQQTNSLCRACSGHDSDMSWREFRTRVVELGGAVVEPMWLGNKRPHRIVCGKGHECIVRPNNVQQGTSICRICAYKVWDVFYVVANDHEQMVKFGITSHDPRARLRFHRADGFNRVIGTITGIADAFELERTVLVRLRAKGVTPMRGREYYDLSTLSLILDIISRWARGI